MIVSIPTLEPELIVNVSFTVIPVPIIWPKIFVNDKLKLSVNISEDVKI